MQLRDDGRVIVGCLLGGLLGGMAIATAWTFKLEKDFWDIFSAVGTMAAAVVALGISLLDTFRRRAAARDRANLAAAKVSVAVAAAIEAIETAESVLDFYDDEPETRDGNLGVVKDLLARASFDVQAEDLVALAPLRNRCAHRIARATAILQLVRSSMNENAWMFAPNPWRDVSKEERTEMAKSWAEKVFRARALLVVASRECEAAAELGAPVPDGQELYGDPC